MNKIRNSVKGSVYISHWLAWIIIFSFITFSAIKDDPVSAIFISLFSSALMALLSYWCAVAESKCLLFALFAGAPLIFGSIGDLSVLLFGRWFYTGTEDLLYFWRKPRTVSKKIQPDATLNTK